MMRSNSLAELLLISSEATGKDACPDYEVPEELKSLYQKNGFFAFESALEVFPAGRSDQSYSLAEWNDNHTWASFYKELRPHGIFFAQSAFGDQFVFNNGFYLFDPETGDVSYLADTIEAWAERILYDYEVLTAQPLAHAWQLENGPIPYRNRLVPITPFILGGAFHTDNMMALDAAAAMRLRGDLALQIRNLPDRASVKYVVRD